VAKVTLSLVLVPILITILVRIGYRLDKVR